jgi:hypothetical protein
MLNSGFMVSIVGECKVLLKIEGLLTRVIEMGLFYILFILLRGSSRPESRLKLGRNSVL